ncbi:unnamed protein product [Rotaria sp. Silwood1]|nr:unnamed protein product [Rotaria sp. Silwood1]CAF3672469.1 unnamed protein product [Rotaria sp. Silwood1]CAF3691067.1 unnamed protein product [Rotaria sp. Silwood1]CAF3767929.1 unnamed protein product [Rotaria sp. Silwood1]CAF4749425.1 unnamed protein product [Rotaria sp. Silwood1]
MVNPNHPQNVTVYRRAGLTPEMIQEYNANVGNQVKWLGFSSTSRNRNKFTTGNTLFIIDIKKPCSLDAGVDIADLSVYPEESEVLLPAGGRFKIERVEYDSVTNIHEINLTIF